MSRFKVGDVIRWVNPDLAEGHWQNLKIDMIDSENYYGTDDICGYGGFCDRWNLELVRRNEPNPFIKTVTETRLVSAYHDLSNGLELFVEPRNDEVKIDIESGTWNKQSLTELAQILSEIAEAM